MRFARMLRRLSFGFLLAAAVAVTAVRMKFLTRSGGYATVIVGAPIMGAGDLPWATLTLLFFLSSSGLSRRARQEREYVEKRGPRDAMQVLANGSVPAFAACLEILGGSSLAPTLFAASLAAATADTWAGEVGVKSTRPPRHILTGREVTPGVSGGVTLTGTGASVAGSSLIAGCAVLFRIVTPRDGAIVAAAGAWGSLVDSLLGATVQSVRFCPRCQVETEQRTHRPCGTPTVSGRGIPWLDNDWVNLTATAIAGLTAVMAVAYLRRTR